MEENIANSPICNRGQKNTFHGSPREFYYLLLQAWKQIFDHEFNFQNKRIFTFSMIKNLWFKQTHMPSSKTMQKPI